MLFFRVWISIRARDGYKLACTQIENFRQLKWFFFFFFFISNSSQFNDSCNALTLATWVNRKEFISKYEFTCKVLDDILKLPISLDLTFRYEMRPNFTRTLSDGKCCRMHYNEILFCGKFDMGCSYKFKNWETKFKVLTSLRSSSWKDVTDLLKDHGG